ncbi:hypothetical protein AXF42_Ash020431 [Apostasia shenzhenica]|uniref:DDE Tnp4 domain-containing protein n=1 Tax=Apostasia shenzhenica TaxID=1088818 RepID=A0A2H9ZYG3_9ASPA|nr:hypothetical protein AXF42_Ash020431 [Apostasia shenzhenica]
MDFLTNENQSAGKFYLVDSGYANTSKFIAPHKGHRYHIGLFKNPASRHYKCPEELYNHRHASLRNVVERTFGILKLRFKLLAKMQSYPFAIQVKIVIACCVLHNIMTGVLGDAEINKYLEGEDITSSLDADMAVHGIDDELESIGCPLIGDSHLGKEIRSQITAELWSSHTGSHLRL